MRVKKCQDYKNFTNNYFFLKNLMIYSNCKLRVTYNKLGTDIKEWALY